MEDSPQASAARPHWSYWLIIWVSLLWNALGVWNFFRQLDAQAQATFPDWLRTIVEQRPAWATAAFAVAVFGGVIGCALLLLRHRAALYVLGFSLLGVVVQMAPALAVGAQAGGAALTMILIPLPLAVFLPWYAWYAAQKGWLRHAVQGESR